MGHGFQKKGGYRRHQNNPKPGWSLTNQPSARVERTPGMNASSHQPLSCDGSNQLVRAIGSHTIQGQTRGFVRRRLGPKKKSGSLSSTVGGGKEGRITSAEICTARKTVGAHAKITFLQGKAATSQGSVRTGGACRTASSTDGADREINKKNESEHDAGHQTRSPKAPKKTGQRGPSAQKSTSGQKGTGRERNPSGKCRAAWGEGGGSSDGQNTGGRPERKQRNLPREKGKGEDADKQKSQGGRGAGVPFGTEKALKGGPDRATRSSAIKKRGTGTGKKNQASQK